MSASLRWVRKQKSNFKYSDYLTFFCFVFRNVSPDCAEAIMTMVQNCSLMLSKGTMSRPPPPGVLRHRALEPFNPATLNSQVS